MPIVTALYAGLLGLMSIAIAFVPGRIRTARGISIGHGDDPALHLAMRRHANFVEFVPLALLLIALLEMNGAPTGVVHGFGASLVAFRIAHALGLRPETPRTPLRGIGAGGSTLVIAAASLGALWIFFSR